MKVSDFKALLGVGDTRRVTITVGTLLEDDRNDAAVRNAISYMKSIVTGNPQMFGAESDFFRWMDAPEHRRQLAEIRCRNNNWDASQVPEIEARFTEGLRRWNDPIWETQTGRHEYRHTLSVCDDAEPLPPEFAVRFPALEHLNLWSFGGLTAFPTLPQGLKTLDLRNAWALARLPELPQSLETLDLSWCRSLATLPRGSLPNLKRLYLGGCVALSQKEFDAFLKAAGCARTLEEIEVHRNPWLRDLRLPAVSPALRVVRASDCPELRVLPSWEGWSELEHLDLRQCPEIRELPRLPVENLRYLGLYGCREFRRYLSQDLNERDLGLRPSDNAAGNFRLRTRLGADVRKRPRCKLLFLGNGRGGKTTLAKALQWREMDAAARTARPELQPREGEDPTHAIHQWDWEPALPETGRDEPAARIRIWDFGGQEAYHGTHRVFAASGSLYVVMLSDGLRESEATAQSHDFMDQNRQRPPEYWLDYILHLDRAFGSPGATPPHVLLVHSRHVGKALAPAILDRMKKRYDGQNLVFAGEWWVGSLEKEWRLPDLEFEKFRVALKAELRRQVREEGIHIPRLFDNVMAEIAARVADVESADDANAILDWAGWRQLVKDALIRCDALSEKDLDRDAEAVARLLHQSGDLFWMRRYERRVILNQRAVLHEIYQLLDLRNERSMAFRESVRKNYGLFESRDLRETWWHRFNPELRNQLLEFMALCQIAVPLFRPGAKGVVREDMLALDPTLLPTFDSEKNALVGRFEGSGIPAKREPWKLLPYEGGAPRMFSESDFRALQAQAVGQFENRVIIFLNGMQYTDKESGIGFRARWSAEAGADGYDGFLDLEYWTPESGEARPRSLTVFIERVLGWEGGPGTSLSFKEWRTAYQPDRSSSPIPIADRKDVSFSVRGEQVEQAQKLEAALEVAMPGRRIFVYKSNPQQTISAAYQCLQWGRVLVLWVSRDYLDANPGNEMTLREFANAILAWAGMQGRVADPEVIRHLAPDQRIFVVFEDGGGSVFREDFRVRVPAALNAMIEHCSAQIARVNASGGSTTKDSLLKDMFRAAGAHHDAFIEFFLDADGKLSDFAGRAPADDQGFHDLAARIARLLD